MTDLRVGLIDRSFIVSCVDGREQTSFFHDLIIGDVDADNAAGNLRADQHRPAIDEGIVRTLVVTGVKIPRDACRDANHDQCKAGGNRDRVLSECAFDALGIRFLTLIGFRRPAVRFSILWICLRFLGPNACVFLQRKIGRICRPLLG